MRPLPAAVMAATLSAVALSAAAKSPGVPEAVRQAVAEVYGPEVDEVIDPETGAGPSRTPPDRMFRRVDINGDGLADWRVDYEKAANASLFCGTGGCLQQLYLARPDGGYDLVFDRNTRLFKMRKAKGEHVLDIDFHGSVCDGAGVEECPRRYAWEPARGRYIERPDHRGGVWLSGGPSPVVDGDPASWPADVRAEAARQEGLCAVDGRKAVTGLVAVNDLPDLNGDGLRDWVVGSSYSACDVAGDGARIDLPVVIMLSRAGGFAKAWEATGPWWGIELGAPSRLVTLEGEQCGPGGSGCSRVTWRLVENRFVR